MPWTLLASAFNKGGTNGGTTNPIDTTGANLIVVAVSTFNIGTLSDSAGNTWVSVEKLSAGATTKGELFYAINPITSAAHTFTYSGTLLFDTVGVGAFSVTGTPIFDLSNSGRQTAATIQPGSITPTSNNSLIIAAGGHDTDPSVYTVDSGLLDIVNVPWENNVNLGLHLTHLTQTTASAINPIFSGNGTPQSRAAWIMNFLAEITDIVNAGSIPSEENFGLLQLDLTLIDTGNINTAEIFDISQLDSVLNNLGGIVTAESFGQPSVSASGASISGAGDILSAESIPSPLIPGANQLIDAGDIFSLESFEIPQIIDTAGFYGSVVGADQFFNSRLNRWGWINASIGMKIKALYHATMLIDRFDYIGQKTNPTQLLEFPRGTSVSIPPQVEKASYLIAQSLLEGRNPDADMESLSHTGNTYGGVRSVQDRTEIMEHVTHLIPSPLAFNLLRPFFRSKNQFEIKRA